LSHLSSFKKEQKRVKVIIHLYIQSHKFYSRYSINDIGLVNCLDHSATVIKVFVKGIDIPGRPSPGLQ
jgi:hypothetical protein